MSRCRRSGGETIAPRLLCSWARRVLRCQLIHLLKRRVLIKVRRQLAWQRCPHKPVYGRKFQCDLGTYSLIDALSAAPLGGSKAIGSSVSRWDWRLARRKKMTNALLRRRRVMFWKVREEASCQCCRDRLASILRNRWEMTWWAV